MPTKNPGPIITLTILSALLLPTASKAGSPDYKDFIPRECRAKKDLRCGTGYKAMTPAELRSIPLVRSNDIRHRGLPAKVDLSGGMPQAGNQGSQGSCAAFATIYHMATYLIARREGWKFDSRGQYGPGRRLLSPAYTYNQITRGVTQGSNFFGHAAILREQGVPPLAYAPYKSRDNATQPSPEARRVARNYRARGYARLTKGNVRAMKAELAKGAPVGTSFCVYPNLSPDARAGRVIDHNSGRCLGGHAVVLVGYDDNKVSPRGHRGAFKFINSWGTYWGKKGYAWFSYRYLVANNMPGYVLHMESVPTRKFQPKSNPKPSPKPNPGPKPNPTPQPFPPAPAPSAERPEPPARVSATRGEYPERILLRWSAVTGARNYKIERAAPGAGTFAHQAYTVATNWTDKKVQAGVAYRYRVVVVDENGSSDPKASPVAEGFARKVPKPTKPSKVSGLSARVMKGRVELSWNKDARANAYVLMRYSLDTRAWKYLASPSGTRYTDRKPEVGTVYYNIKARNKVGDGPYTSSIRVKFHRKYNRPPDRVQGLQVSRGLNGRIELKWELAPRATSYRISTYNSKARRWESLRVSKTNRFTDRPNRKYAGGRFTYVLQAANSRGTSGYSSQKSGRFVYKASRSQVGLAAPAGLRQSAGRAGTWLKWNRVRGAGSYVVYRRAYGEKVYRRLQETKATRLALKIEPGRLYYYKVSAKKGVGESELSRAITAFRNGKRVLVKRRFTGREGFERFAGRWKGRLWEGLSRTHSLELELDWRGAGGFRARLYLDGRQVKTYRGDYTADSRSLEAEGLRLTIHPDFPDMVQFTLAERKVGGLELPGGAAEGTLKKGGRK